MAQWLPLPTWDGMHPQVIHFPITLLLVAPLFIFLGLLRPERWRLFSVAAGILMLLGTIAAYVAVATGQAAAQLADSAPPIQKAIGQHQAMAENTRLIFTILTIIFAALLSAPRVIKNPAPRLLRAAHIVFLLIYLGSCLGLARTAHLGGRLVHHYGVHAIMNDPEVDKMPE